MLALRCLVGPVVEHRQAHSWGGVAYDGEHRYVALPLGRDVEVRLDRLEPAAVGDVPGGRRWTPDGYEAGATYEPPALPDIMRAGLSTIEGET